MSNRNVKITVYSLIGVVVFFALCAVAARFINKNDIGLGQELTPGEPAYISVDNELKAEVTVYSARELNESEGIKSPVSANGKTLVEVQVSVDILDSSYSWDSNCMRVRDSAGKYGEVVSFRNGTAICRLENPSEQISFFIYTGDWTTSSSIKSTGRYKLPVEPASDDPVEQTRRGLEANRLVIQGLTMDLAEGFTYVDHFVQENWVYLEYEDMVVDINIYEYADITMDTETLIKQNRVIGTNQYEMLSEPVPANLNDTPWYHMIYEEDGLLHSSYFFVENQVSYIVDFFTEDAVSGLDNQRITEMMKTAVLENN